MAGPRRTSRRGGSEPCPTDWLRRRNVAGPIGTREGQASGYAEAVRIAWLTDIHLDHLDKVLIDALSWEVAKTAPDAVVVTGDISVAARLGEHLERFGAAFEAPVHFVMGNHDYWGSSAAATRAALTKLAGVAPRMRWLQHEGPVWLDEQTALVGVDGWSDARIGDYATSPVKLRDYELIAELATGDIHSGVVAARALADADATLLAEHLEHALQARPHVYVATHVPPFAEAARFAGNITTPQFLPWVTCKAVGDVVLEAADRHPKRRISVLCGHMHHFAHEQIRPNLEVRTGAATYGKPAIAAILDTCSTL